MRHTIYGAKTALYPGTDFRIWNILQQKMTLRLMSKEIFELAIGGLLVFSRLGEELDVAPLIGQVVLTSADAKSESWTIVKNAPTAFLDAGLQIGTDFRQYSCPYRIEALTGLLRLKGRVTNYYLPLILRGRVYKTTVGAKRLPDNNILLVFTSAEYYLDGHIDSYTVFKWLNLVGESEKITTGCIGNTLLVSVGDRIQKNLLWEKRGILGNAGVNFYLILKGETVGVYHSGKVGISNKEDKQVLLLPKLETQQSEYARIHHQELEHTSGVFHFYSPSLIHLASWVDYHPDQLNRPLEQIVGKPLAESGLEDSIWIPRRRIIGEAIASGQPVTIKRTHKWKGFEWLMQETVNVLDNGEIKIHVEHGREWQKQAWASYCIT